MNKNNNLVENNSTSDYDLEYDDNTYQEEDKPFRDEVFVERFCTCGEPYTYFEEQERDLCDICYESVPEDQDPRPLNFD